MKLAVYGSWGPLLTYGTGAQPATASGDSRVSEYQSLSLIRGH